MASAHDGFARRQASASVPVPPLISAVVFDYGHVLEQPLDPEAVAARRTRLALQYGLPDAKAFHRALYESPAWAECKVGRIDRAEMFARVAEALGQDRSVGAHMSAEYEQGMGVRDDMRHLLEQLRARGIRTGVLSNYDETLEKRLREFGVRDLLDEVVVSYHIGVAKPSEAAYRALLERLRVPAEHVAFFDDKAANVQAAIRVGMHAFVFTDVPTARRDLHSLGVALDAPV